MPGCAPLGMRRRRCKAVAGRCAHDVATGEKEDDLVAMAGAVG